MIARRTFNIKPYLLLLVVATIYLTLLPAALLIRGPDTLYILRMLGVAAYNAIGILCLFYLLSAIGRSWIRTVLYWLVLAYIIFYSLSLFYHILIYDQMLGVPAISAILDTNPHDAAEYADTFSDMRAAMFALFLSAPVIWAFSCRCEPVQTRKPLIVLLALVVAAWPAIGLTKEFMARNSLILLVGDSLHEVISAKYKIDEVLASFRAIPKGEIVKADTRPRVHVLLLGESTTRNHMSLYGYHRDTNPLLGSIRDDLHIATNVCSSRGATVPQLKELFTFANREDSEILFKAPNIVEVMKAAGFKTFWLSNQQSYGLLSAWAGVFAGSADMQRFVNARGGDDVSYQDAESLDDKLFAPLEEALADPARSKFIVLHLMGSHAAYDLRYPDEYRKFAPDASRQRAAGIMAWFSFLKRKTADIDAYDNTVLYNDYIVHSIIRRLDKAGADTMVYLSDHGEGLGEGGPLLDHLVGPTQKQVYEIPLIFHFGTEFAQDRPDLMARIGPALDRPFQSDHLIHTMLDIYGIASRAARPEWSLFAPTAHPRQRYCDTLGSNAAS